MAKLSMLEMMLAFRRGEFPTINSCAKYFAISPSTRGEAERTVVQYVSDQPILIST